MNINTLNEFIEDFRHQVVESGFKRDVTDYVSSLPSLEENIVSLRATATSVLGVLSSIHASDLPSALVQLFPSKKPIPFTKENYDEKIRVLLDNKEVQQDEFYAELSNLLGELQTSLEANEEEVDRISDFISPYVAGNRTKLTADQKAVFSILFKDKGTTSLLKEFSKTVALWSRTLPQYHKLVTGTSPEDVDIVAVQNGSIDMVVNLDVKVAVDLADLFKYGLLAFAAYLAHKKQLLPMIAGYRNNPRLLELDKKKDELLLENIGHAVETEARAQFEKVPKRQGSAPDNPELVIEQVTRMVTSHIVKGNDVKLLALPVSSESNKVVADRPEVARELSKAATDARQALRALPAGELTPLLECYGNTDENISAMPNAQVPRSKAKKKQV